MPWLMSPRRLGLRRLLLLFCWLFGWLVVCLVGWLFVWLVGCWFVWLVACFCFAALLCFWRFAETCLISKKLCLGASGSVLSFALLGAFQDVGGNSGC